MSIWDRSNFELDNQSRVIIVFGTIAFYLLYRFKLGSIFWGKFLKLAPYLSLSEEDQDRFVENSTAVMNSIVLVIASPIVWYTAEEFHVHHDLHYYDNLLAVILCYAEGFWIFHSTFIVLPDLKKFFPWMVLHHATTLCAIAIGIFSREYPFHICMVLTFISELPNINVNGLWYLNAFGMRRHILYVVNGVFIWVFWFLTRIVLLLYLGYILYIEHWEDQFMKTESGFHFFYCNFQFGAVFLLNFVWFFKITKGLVKVLLGKKTQLDKNPNKMN